MATIPKILQEAAASCKNDWTAKELKVLVWLANPTHGKQRELAAEFAGLRDKPESDWTEAERQKMIYQEQEISRIKAKPGFKEDLARFAMIAYIEYDLDVDRANLRDAVKDPKNYPDIATAIMTARKLYYQRRGLLVERRENSGPGGGPIQTENVIKDERLSDIGNEELSVIIDIAKERAALPAGGGGSEPSE